MGLVDLGLEGSDVGDAGLQFCEAGACVESGGEVLDGGMFCGW